jgi:hypothetical protein
LTRVSRLLSQATKISGRFTSAGGEGTITVKFALTVEGERFLDIPDLERHVVDPGAASHYL